MFMVWKVVSLFIHDKCLCIIEKICLKNAKINKGITTYRIMYYFPSPHMLHGKPRYGLPDRKMVASLDATFPLEASFWRWIRLEEPARESVRHHEPRPHARSNG
jgi:hypothetical protein